MTESHGVGRTNTPDTKIQAAGAAGAASILIVWLVGQFGVDMPPEASAALATLLAFAAGYFKRETGSGTSERGLSLLEALVVLLLLAVVYLAVGSPGL